jgi:ribosome-binding factor A
MEEYSTRQNKISRLVQREMADILLKLNKSKYPGKLISVSVVRVTRDLGIARVYLSIFPSEYTTSILADIQLHVKQIRGDLGKRVGKSMRAVPQLEFYVDDSLDYIDNINKLLHS